MITTALTGPYWEEGAVTSCPAKEVVS